MPKWKTNKKTEKQGVSFIRKLVEDHGSIFREVPGDTDTGIDGFIEFVNNEEVSGHLLGVQVKSGDSFYNAKKNKFIFYPDIDHLNYWESYMIPVILVFYSPIHKCGSWISIDEHLNHLRYHNKPLTQKIEVNVNSDKKEIVIDDLQRFAHMKYDSKILIKCLDQSIIKSNTNTLQYFEILTNHPDSRDSKIVVKIARELISHEDPSVKREALWYLGYCVGRTRWSWNPNNSEERDFINFSTNICSDISGSELYPLLCLVDNECFSGPIGLGERLYDIICCCFDNVENILIKTAADKTEPIKRRNNALYMLYDCDDDQIENDFVKGTYDKKYEDLFKYLTSFD